MRVVLYAEGAAETAARCSLAAAPGNLLSEDVLGPAHVLIRRAIALARGVPPAAVRFQAPLRVGVRQAVGSDLLDRQRLRRLLAWADPKRRPDMAVVLVDRDGDVDRKRMLSGHVEHLLAAPVIAVAVEEFEAWLLADEKALSAAAGATVQAFANPEGMKPREAKAELRKWIGDDPARRKPVAEQCRLDVVRGRCPAFEDLLADLGRTPPA